MSRSIPDRWLQYEPYGDIIDGVNILAFKVPLKEAVSKNLPLSQQFVPSMLLKKFPKLKYVVDLTNTERYYDPKKFKDSGINYIKIMIPGRELPSHESVLQFYKAMETFKSTAKNDEIIGVHCTHGINRTGYLICRYLVQQLGWEPETSVKAFEKARGYPIERENYVTELMKIPRDKVDVSSVTLDVNPAGSKVQLKRPTGGPGPSRISAFDHRARYGNTRPYPLPPHQPFGYGGPIPPRGFGGPRPPLIPPCPMPPPPNRWLDGPRPHAYGMLPSRPPGPGPFPGPGPCFPPKVPGSPRLLMPNKRPPSRLPSRPPLRPPPRPPGPGMLPPRLPPPGIGSPRLPLPLGMLPSRLPIPGMPPPRMLPPRLPNIRRIDHPKQGVVPIIKSSLVKLPAALQATGDSGSTNKIIKDLDFTVDTFDENLIASVCP